TTSERTLLPAEEHGFLWRQNTYWSYEEQNGGLYIQVESISLTRSVPRGLGWAVGPYVQSIPRESLEFTLQCVCDALHRKRYVLRIVIESSPPKENRLMNAVAVPVSQSSFVNAVRINRSLTANLEKRALVWAAERPPQWVTSDRLTILGFAAQ